MKKFSTILFLVLILSLSANAQGPGRRGGGGMFNPEQFQAELEQYITREACLTPAEAAAFFPVYRELGNKQRAIFNKSANHRYVKPIGEEACREAIIQRDENDLQLKKLQQEYHLKFLSILPATKVFDVLMAEDRFHRDSFRRIAERRRNK